MNHRAELFVALQRLLPKHALSRLIAKAAESKNLRLKNWLIERAIKAFDINIDEFVEASRKRLNLADSEILAMKIHLLRKKTEKKQTNIIKLVSNLGNENSPRIDVSELEYIETTNETGNKVIRVHFNGEPFEGIGFEYFEANNQKYYMEWEYDKTMGQMVSFAEQTEYDRLNG